MCSPGGTPPPPPVTDYSTQGGGGSIWPESWRPRERPAAVKALRKRYIRARAAVQKVDDVHLLELLRDLASPYAPGVPLAPAADAPAGPPPVAKVNFSAWLADSGGAAARLAKIEADARAQQARLDDDEDALEAILRLLH